MLLWSNIYGCANDIDMESELDIFPFGTNVRPEMIRMALWRINWRKETEFDFDLSGKLSSFKGMRSAASEGGISIT